MPASSLSRHSRPSSPPLSSHTTTPARTKHLYPVTSAQTIASTTSSPTITASGQQQKLNVVTRVAIEGWAKQGEDGAGIKMYLKVRIASVSLSTAWFNGFLEQISLPLDNVVAGMTIPLFQG